MLKSYTYQNGKEVDSQLAMIQNNMDHRVEIVEAVVNQHYNDAVSIGTSLLVGYELPRFEFDQVNKQVYLVTQGYSMFRRDDWLQDVADISMFMVERAPETIFSESYQIIQDTLGNEYQIIENWGY